MSRVDCGFYFGKTQGLKHKVLDLVGISFELDEARVEFERQQGLFCKKDGADRFLGSFDSSAAAVHRGILI